MYGNDITVYKPADTGRSSDHRSITCLSGRKCPDGSIHGLGVQGRIHYGRNRYYYQAAATKVPVPQDGSIVFLTDVVIVIASAFVFRNVDKALYAGIVVIITSVVLDVVLYGRDEAKLIYIISDHAEKIAGRLLEELDIGVTYVQGSGAYSGKEKSVIMCAMKKNISPKAEEIVKEEDPLAFMIVTSATEIFGEGYKSYFSEKL